MSNKRFLQLLIASLIIVAICITLATYSGIYQEKASDAPPTFFVETAPPNSNLPSISP